MLSGMDAWSVFLSFSKTMFPSCKMDDATFKIAETGREEQIIQYTVNPRCWAGCESNHHWAPKVSQCLSFVDAVLGSCVLIRVTLPDSLLTGENNWKRDLSIAM